VWWGEGLEGCKVLGILGTWIGRMGGLKRLELSCGMIPFCIWYGVWVSFMESK
jgi:hypothetical protein